MNLTHFLQQQAATQPHSAAIIEAKTNRSITFAQLEQASNQAASLLQQSGLKSGVGVLIFQPMSIQLYVALLAIWRLGMVAIFVDPSAGRSHLDRCCQIYPPQALIASSKAHLLRFRSAKLRRIPHKFAIGWPVPGAKHWAFSHRNANVLPAACADDAPALLTFTSGSTGQPKAALRTHGFLQAQHRSLSQTLQLQAGEIDLTTLPIFLLANLASGVTSLIPAVDLRFPGQIDAAQVVRQIRSYQPQTIAASPAFLTRLADYCQDHDLLLDSFERIYSGGAPVFPSLLARLQALAPRAEVSAVYGSTEAEPIAHIAYRQIQPADFSAMQQGKGLLVGKPVPTIDVRILPLTEGTIAPLSKTKFATICLPAGQIGEIVVAGNHVLSSYLHGQGDTETKFRVEEQPWHRTRDAGYFDTQGRLWLLGRDSARIQDQLGDLYPFAVETAISHHSQIRRSALVQVQGQRWLIIEPVGISTIESDSLQNTLEWTHLDRIQSCRSIPVDGRHNAKIDYYALKKLCAQWQD